MTFIRDVTDQPLASWTFLAVCSCYFSKVMPSSVCQCKFVVMRKVLTSIGDAFSLPVFTLQAFFSISIYLTAKSDWLYMFVLYCYVLSNSTRLVFSCVIIREVERTSRVKLWRGDGCHDM